VTLTTQSRGESERRVVSGKAIPVCSLPLSLRVMSMPILTDFIKSTCSRFVGVGTWSNNSRLDLELCSSKFLPYHLSLCFHRGLMLLYRTTGFFFYTISPLAVSPRLFFLYLFSVFGKIVHRDCPGQRISVIVYINMSELGSMTT
jgi:hypothetical protein